VGGKRVWNLILSALVFTLQSTQTCSKLSFLSFSKTFWISFLKYFRINFNQNHSRPALKRNTGELAYCYHVFCQHYQYSKDSQIQLVHFYSQLPKKSFQIMLSIIWVIRYSFSQSDHIKRCLNEKEGKVEQK
jgi:hypothetical protein